MHALRMWRHGDPLSNLPPKYTEAPIPGHLVVVEGIECWSTPMAGILANGREFIVDLQDRSLVEPHRWHISNHGYAARHDGPKKVQIHQLLLIVEDGFEVDHKNRNKLDDRRSNLRPAEHFKNCFNCNLRRNKTSRFRGVFLDKRRSVWRAEIRSNGRTVFIGSFKNEEDAALAWNEAALERGEFAVFNSV